MRARGLKQARQDVFNHASKSRPMRARGLKQHMLAVVEREVRVAPHAGAWVETKPNESCVSATASRPMRARGLKHALCQKWSDASVSRPMRARGLKLEGGTAILLALASRPMRARGLKLEPAQGYADNQDVAPHAGAWVETLVALVWSLLITSRAPCGRVG